MTVPPVTDDDVHAFYDSFYQLPDGIEVERIGIDPTSPHGEKLMDAYRRAIANDRQRVADHLSNQT